MQIKLPDLHKAPGPEASLIKWILFFIHPHRVILSGFIFLHLVRKTFFRCLPLFMGVTIGLTANYLQTGEDLMRIPLWIGFFGVLNFIVVACLFLFPVQNACFDRISKEVSLFGLHHYMTLSEAWHENRASGEKLQRLLTARQNIFNILENIYWQLLEFPATLIAITISVLVLDAPWYYVIILYSFLLSYMAAAHILGQKLHGRYANYYSSHENVVGRAYEFLNSIMTLRFFNLQNQVLGMASELETQNHHDRRTVMHFSFFRWFVLNNIAYVWLLIIMTLSTYDVIQGRMEISALSAILFLSVSIWLETEFFAIIYVRMVDEFNGIKRLFDIFKERPNVIENSNAETLAPDQYDIHLDHIKFEYALEKSIIKDITLHIKAGEKIGLLGPSGAGKSTLVKLIMRLYDPVDGHIRIGGQDIRSITQKSLFDAIAVIPQDIALFNHPVIENIRYGRLTASDEEIIEAAKKAHAHEFILNLPEGYQTKVGERGVKLSGGQRQRIAIARAILKNAPILILDEATSSLDSVSEELIQKSLAGLMEGKTVIAIAHRLSTIAALDRLVVIQNGEILEQGSHTALIQQNGLYARLWSMQSGGFIKE